MGEMLNPEVERERIAIERLAERRCIECGEKDGRTTVSPYCTECCVPSSTVIRP